MLDPLTLAAWQCAPAPDDPLGNAERLTDAARRARAAGARLLVAPELSLTGYDVAELDPAATLRAVDLIATAAHDAELPLIAGVARLVDGHLRNSAVAVDAAGAVRAIHDKAHLFGTLDQRFSPGDVPVTVVDLAGLTVGILICYEIEFPEPARLAALAGVDVLAVPTANMRPFEGVHDLLVPARALENGIPVVYANRVGQERETVYLGRSMLVDGDGVVRAEAERDAEAVLVADLGPGRSTQLADRRPQLFAGLVMGQHQ